MAIGAPYVASSSPSASQDVGQKVMQDWLNLGGGPERELTHGRTINDACPNDRALHIALWLGSASPRHARR